MATVRALSEEFKIPLQTKGTELITLYTELRNFILDRYKGVNELLYHTHALSSVYSVSQKMGDGFCLIPIYSEHLNLGFQCGGLLKDPDKLLKGTGKLMRHIKIKSSADFSSLQVQRLLDQAYSLAIPDCLSIDLGGKTISKIKS